MMDPRWGEFRTNRASLSLEEQRQMDEEVANFLSTALDVHGHHSVRWLTSLVDCSLAHHNTQLAVACGAALLAIYDGACPCRWCQAARPSRRWTARIWT